jgi:hypothetical protein
MPFDREAAIPDPIKQELGQAVVTFCLLHNLTSYDQRESVIKFAAEITDITSRFILDELEQKS